MMRIFEDRVREVDTIPAKAGEAVLRFSENLERPVRRGPIITIPQRPGVEFFQLRGGEQFLLGIIEPRTGYGSMFSADTDSFSLYFGGTDEQPFLVELDPVAFCYFDEWGEEGFFDGLKPETIRSYEEQWGKERTKRQGFIFAYELPCDSWQELIVSQWRRGTEIVLRDVEERLFGTRHVLMGRKALISSGSDPDAGPAFVASGVVLAERRKPLVLKTPHQVIQSDLLRRPSGVE